MTDLKTRITEEIESVQMEIEQAKHRIKHNTASGLSLIETEQVLRELRTRLAVLEANLIKANTPASEVRH
jgi:hypothetical protein